MPHCGRKPQPYGSSAATATAHRTARYHFSPLLLSPHSAFHRPRTLRVPLAPDPKTMIRHTKTTQSAVSTRSPDHTPATITLFLIVLGLALVPLTNAWDPYMRCRMTCNAAYLSCMNVYGQWRLRLRDIIEGSFAELILMVREHGDLQYGGQDLFRAVCVIAEA